MKMMYESEAPSRGGKRDSQQVFACGEEGGGEGGGGGGEHEHGRENRDVQRRARLPAAVRGRSKIEFGV